MDHSNHHRTPGWAALVLIACSACTGQPNAVTNQGTLAMTPETAEFVRAYQTRQLSNAATNDIPLQISFRIGASSDANVCTTGELYGPYTFTNNTVEGDQTDSATPPTLRLANMGDLTVCMIITSPVDATLDLSADSLNMETSECSQTPADIAGVWEGAYSCTSNCGDYDGFVALTIVQDNYSATYSDNEASYEGTVCGRSFNYSGSGPGYTESGTFVLNNDGTGSKTSSYVYDDESCSGECSDPVLVRY